MSNVDIKIEITDRAKYLIDSINHPTITDWKLFQNYPHDAGFDLMACIESPLILYPRKWYTFPTGMKVQLPIGWELQVRPRSGLANREGITVLNTPGTVDFAFRSEIGIILHNTSDKNFVVKPGDRIAQACIREVPSVNISYVDTISETIEEEVKNTDIDLKADMAIKLAKKRGGFGSSGV